MQSGRFICVRWRHSNHASHQYLKGERQFRRLTSLIWFRLIRQKKRKKKADIHVISEMRHPSAFASTASTRTALSGLSVYFDATHTFQILVPVLSIFDPSIALSS